MAVAPAPAARPRPGGGRLFIIIGVVVALLGGGGALFLASQGGGGGGGGATVTVVVAAQAIPVRHEIVAGDLTTAKVSLAAPATNNTFTKPADVVKQISLIGIAKGSIITTDMVNKNPDIISTGSSTSYLPLASGYVALTIPTGEQQGVAGHISIGDYITIIASASVSIFKTTPSGGGQAAAPPKFVTKTIFTQVRVIGLGPAIVNVSSASGSSGGAQTAPPTGGITSSLTIEMTQCDAEYMTWFLANTTLKYTEESFHDFGSAPTAPDSSCPNVLAAKGVSNTQVDTRFGFSGL